MMIYRYVDTAGNPILSCPECDNRWDADGGITLTVSINGSLDDHNTLLKDDGTLVDVDRAVENGYHSCTACSKCGEILINMEGIIEETDD